MGRYPLGVVGVTFAPLPTTEASVRARDLGFELIDAPVQTDPSTLALPVGCPDSDPNPIPGWGQCPAPHDGPGRWETTVERFRAAPGCLLEPWAHSCVNSLEKIRAIADEIAGLRFVIDTGHVAAWGGDPVELLEYADHVQLRQGKPGHGQLHVDDPTGTVTRGGDPPARPDRLPGQGCGRILQSPRNRLGPRRPPAATWAVDLAARVRPLLI